MSCSPYAFTKKKKRIPNIRDFFKSITTSLIFLFPIFFTSSQYNWLKKFVKIRNWFFVKRFEQLNFCKDIELILYFFPQCVGVVAVLNFSWLAANERATVYSTVGKISIFHPEIISPISLSESVKI